MNADKVIGLLSAYTCEVKGTSALTSGERTRIELLVKDLIATGDLSWFFQDHVCSWCSYPVVVTQGKQWDYRYYCSNPDCFNHQNPRDLGDQEDPPDWCRKVSKETTNA